MPQPQTHTDPNTQVRWTKPQRFERDVQLSDDRYIVLGSDQDVRLVFDSANGVFLIQTNDGATWWDRLTLEAINYDLRPEGNDQAINVRLIPTGTGERSQLQLLSASDPANTDVFRLDRDEANDEWVIQATKVGSGVVRPININITGVGDVLRVDTSGNLILPNGNYLELLEMAAPGAGGANTVRIYAVEDGGTLTDLAAVFQDGTVDIFAQEV